MAVENENYREFGGGGGTHRKEGVTFKLGGQVFTTVAEAPAGVMNDLMAGVSLSEDGDRVYSAPNLIRFVTGVLREEEELTVEEASERGVHLTDEMSENGMVIVPTDDVRRFRQVVNSKRVIIPIDELGEVVMWLAEKLTDRPTLLPARSARGR